MTQSTVTILINGQPYQMGCDVGQETHVEQMGRNVDAIIQHLVGSVGQIGDARLLAMASLILSDQVHTANGPELMPNPDLAANPDLGRKNEALAANRNPVDGHFLSKQQVETLVDQINKMAETIEHLAQSD